MAAAMPATVEDVLTCMAALPTAAPRIDRLAAVMGLDQAELQALLAAAAAAGLVQYWDQRPGYAGVCLSPLAAARMGLRLDADGVHYSSTGRRRCYCGRWTGRAEKPVRVAPAPEDGEDTEADPQDLLAELPDHRTPAPELAAMAVEAAERLPTAAEATPRSRADYDPARLGRGAFDPDRLPEPILILGLRLTWPVSFHGGSCPAGHGEQLPRIAACVVCDRSGIDHLLPSVEGTRRHARRAGRLKGGLAGKQ